MPTEKETSEQKQLQDEVGEQQIERLRDLGKQRKDTTDIAAETEQLRQNERRDTETETETESESEAEQTKKAEAERLRAERKLNEKF